MEERASEIREHEMHGCHGMAKKRSRRGYAGKARMDIYRVETGNV